MISIAVPLLALLVTVAASLGLQLREQAARSTARASFNLIGAADRVLGSALDGETAVRGYAATGDPVFLQPYNEMRARMHGAQAEFKTAASRAGEVGQAQEANRAADQVFGQLERIRGAVAHGAPATQVTRMLQQGRRSMDLLRTEINGLRTRAVNTMTSQRANVDQAQTGIDVTMLVGVLLGLLAGVAGVALFASGVSRRVVAAGANADRLGAGQPIVATGQAGDEIGRLADSLASAEQLLASRTAQLVAARDEALKANQAKNAFLSATSHELRTPLNSILGFTQLLELSDLSAEDRDSVQRILAAGRHLLALINELIDIARIESGELSVSLEPVSVRALLADVCQLMQPLADERGIELTQKCMQPGLAVYADWQRLWQIMVNLVSNAVKYNRRGGTITVTCQEYEDGKVAIAVADTGPGLSDEDMDRIFVPFERLSAEQSDVEGTGIGLPLARALARVMQGELMATSTVGLGSTFTVSLRRAGDLTRIPGQASRSVSHTSNGRAEISRKSTLTLLYIEDNPANVEVVARYLASREEARLLIAASGGEGLAAAAEHRPDLILLDLHLSDMTGEQVLSQMRAEPATGNIPVAVLSADASPRVIRRLLTSGASAYLTKPLELARLGELLDSYETDPHAKAGHLGARP
ncbi:MAG: response regulator [Nocardiopsaceae bacterium]|jgi:signal transduction histidine kinase/ActR/RegA family two-component response regulator|nr:response regulator [Nocardiopsaceae bacterium]